MAGFAIAILIGETEWGGVAAAVSWAVAATSVLVTLPVLKHELPSLFEKKGSNQ